MTGGAGQWDDLLVRVVSGLALLGVGLLAVWLGGAAFKLLICTVVSVMIWELARICGAGPWALALGAGAGAVLALAFQIPVGGLWVLCAAPILAWPVLQRHKPAFVGFAIAIFLSGYGLVSLRDGSGMSWIIWLVLLVVATDVGGYFGGRLIGGPKFWPAVSPKKTWAGIVSGWGAAALVTAMLAPLGGVGWSLLALAVGLSFASQLGDVAESALKRRAGVKDSSAIIPGHGGMMDRFDSMLGASLCLFAVQGVVQL